MTVPPPPLKRTLLTMLGGASPGAMDEPAWHALDAMAAQHRLQPLLAWQCDRSAAGWTVPSVVVQGWRAARHRAGLATLAQQAALRLAAGRLNAAGVRFCVLKGPRLAWACYPEPGLRPMRDLDLLVGETDLLVAAGVLGEAGFAMAGDAAALAEALAKDKHLPPLRHGRLGVDVELHHRLSDPPGRRGYRIPQLDPAEVLARSEPLPLAGDMLLCPAPADLLAHLMVHALYGHRLDCGPLVLADIHFLLSATLVEPAELRARAEAGGWCRGAGLLLALTERHFGPQPIRPADLAPLPPDAMLAIAEDALLQNLASREHAEALADVLAATSPAALARTLARRLRPARHVVAGESAGLVGWRFWPLWVLRRLRRLGARLADPRAGREARSAAALLRWLQS